MYEFRENVYIITTDIYVSLVVECTQKRDAIEAAAIYTHMKKNAGIVRFLKGSTGLCLLNRILLMLVSCGCFDVAHQLFDEMPRRNFISLAIVMAALIDNHLFEEALGLFEVDLGKMVHGWMLKMGYDRGLVVDTALVEFYGKSGCLMEANHVFFDLIRVVDHRDTVLWTGVIVNNGREQCFGEVIRIFRVMGEAGVRMNEYTFSTVLKACGRVGDGGLFGQQIHANAIKLGFDSHVFVMCALIDMYGRCGLLNDAKRVFDRMDRRKRNNACWNAMVTGFIHHGLYIDALKTLYEMKAAGLKPQKSVMDEVRLACGSLKLEIT
uniref:Pentatricopeptide repeat-containing protein n=1 Tax=Chenopodium quinoa TaxID=63459 RepID=A0A803NCB1_CHEQI